MSAARSWDIGDPEPDGVGSVDDGTDSDSNEASSSWGRTFHGEWKGYKDGGKIYLDWAELVRRWGPVTEVIQ